MKSSQADKDFLHRLFVKHYRDRPAEPEHREACIRCGAKGRLGVRKPYAGLCRTCRAAEYSKN